MSEDRGFEVKDRQRVQDSNGDAGTPPDHEAEEEFAPGGPPMEVTVQGVLRFSVEFLSLCAWTNMGLRPDPVTGKIERNLDEARRAIDVLGALAPHVEAGAEADEKRDLRNLLADLRVNFLRQSNPSG